MMRRLFMRKGPPPLYFKNLLGYLILADIEGDYSEPFAITAKVKDITDEDVELIDPTGEVDWARIYLKVPGSNPRFLQDLREKNPKEIYAWGTLKVKYHGEINFYPDKAKDGRLLVQATP